MAAGVSQRAILGGSKMLATRSSSYLIRDELFLLTDSELRPSVLCMSVCVCVCVTVSLCWGGEGWEAEGS